MSQAQPSLSAALAGQGRVAAGSEQTGVWKADAENHRCLVDPAVWRAIPLEKKEDILKAIYREEGTWWKLQDIYSGKFLAEVGSWGAKVYP